MVIVLRDGACAPLPCGKPLIRPICKRIAHLLREGEGFLLGSVFFNAKGDPSTKSLNAILPTAPLRMTVGGNGRTHGCAPTYNSKTLPMIRFRIAH